jgi:hypothetical protein
MIKKRLSAVIAVLLLFSAVNGTAYAAGDAKPTGTQASITLDGASIDTNAYVQDETVYLPLRALCKALGYTVSWKNGSNGQTITAVKGVDSIQFNLDKQTVTHNDHTYYASGIDITKDSLVSLSGRTYLDADLFSENFHVLVHYNEQNKTVTLTHYTENAINITTMKLNTDNKNLEVDLQYPQIDGLKNTDVQDKINTALRDAALNALNQGLQNSFALMQDKQVSPDNPNSCSTEFNYRITYNRSGLLCVLCSDYQYAGGAHGSTYQTTYLFDLSTGNTLNLADLMKSGSSYQTYFDTAIRKEIDKRVAAGELAEFEGSEFKTIGDKPEFYLNNDSIVFYFQQYEYFPYAAGIQQFRFPYSELTSLLKSGNGLS